ncbi:hypothetical protein A2Z53_03235 [Candidatus Giovannonibacteria bacterium RIFCSPHIGHO2_02_42_15]|uniref:SpaA-like prealbumin fold domain-containing protein n=1 Tax=Candidatus Giovannonibacteria bacterium RIFCSPHIGHO2_02_42_15 TaxID=1798329 RepID=A0A1F5VPI8_9BACT|nr:MAG: hypothetical protein A2Z53_03235 [Candidatus Giovannonibacteria bacterium RIFCSPHIGHO2_02_42_15]
MKKIITSLSVIVAVSAIAIGATNAFLSDTETSSGNTFAAGAIDLKIDNESYYNGVLNELTSWTLADLPNGKLFFNFTDLKPDDEGEDTISLHVNDNDAYLCMDMTLTSNDDESSNEPELEAGDDLEDANLTWDGELAQNLQMFWWADDGDNVYEVGENSITNGVQTITNMFGPDHSFSIPLADSENNIWTPNDPTPDPVPGDTTVYIAKAWCFGTLGLAPLAQDNAGTDGPLLPNRVGTGVACDGTVLGNITQTDGVTLDLAFRAVQSRHIPDYVCNDGEPRTATLTVNKVIITDNGGNETINSFQLSVVGTVVTDVTSGVANQFVEGSYVVTETGVSGYQATFSGDCNAAGQITLASGDSKTCTITNNDIAPSITLIKNVVNNSGGNAVPVQFIMRIDGNVVPQNTSVAVSANSVHAISEDAFSEYTLTGVSGTGCPATIPGNVTLNEGEAITCTITNDDN